MEERMRLSQLFSVVATVLLLPAVAIAEESLEPTTTPGPEAVESAAANAEGDDLGAMSGAQSDAPEFVLGLDEPAGSEDAAGSEALAASEESEVDVVLESDTQTAAPEAWVTTTVEIAPARVTASGVVLGPKGVDDEGRIGRLHTVATGDTLWDLAAAYLGTPWVWPSVWIDNDDIENPHLIEPGDKIWITANEMRRVSDAEAESFLEPIVEDIAAALDMGGESLDAAEDSVPPLAALEAVEDDSTALDAFPVEVPGPAPEAMIANRQITVASREMMGFVSAETLAGASSLVESTTQRTFLTFGDSVVLGLGEGEVEVGDQYSIFQIVEEVRDPGTNRVLGHHVEKLGWVEVNELTGDTSIGSIRQAYDLIRRGALIVPREQLSRHVTVISTPDAIEGQIIFLPYGRSLVGDGSFVYLNRGEFHGVEVGSELEVFDGGLIVNERERRVDVRTPDQGAATLIVVSVEADTSVAFVLNATRELAIGDRVRPVVARLAKR